MIPHLPAQDRLPQLQQQFVDALRTAQFSGDIATDYASRLVAATDNSIYQILPAAVLFPKNAEDIHRILRLAGTDQYHGIAFSARGAGTGTNGQSLTGGMIIDCARYMNGILELNLDEAWVRVESGVVRDQLNAYLKPHGVFFAPDLSPSNRATVGGMINTDACGKGSRTYGRTSNHVLELDLVLADGSQLKARGLDHDALETHKSGAGREAEIYQLVDDIVTKKAKLIESTFPKMKRFLTGYNLAHVKDDDGLFHLAQLVCGSEGSLAVVSQAKLKLTPLPKSDVLVAVKYASFDDALADAIALLNSEPTTIETIDETILELAREDAIWFRVKAYIGEPGVKTVNLVEYSGNDLDTLNAKVERLQEAINRGESRAVGCYVTTDNKIRSALWDLRKKGVGLLGNMKGPRKPIAFVEDTAVPPENLADYIRDFRALLDGHGLQYAMYGHVDVGCLHVRPALDPRQEGDARLVREVSDGVMNLVRKYGGIMWAEHGKGFRSEYTPLFFGDELYEDLRRIKGVFDPHNQMNPGKVVTPAGSDDVVVAIEAPLKGEFDRQVPKPDQEAFDPAFGCNGNGVCFNADAHHIMCPSSKITRDRIHSPKGRAALMREWLRRLAKDNQEQAFIQSQPKAGNLLGRLWRKYFGPKDDLNHQIKAAMSGCLSCKACATQCPIHVNIPEYKAHFLNAYYTRYARSPRDYLIGMLEFTLPLQTKMTGLVNAMTGMVPNSITARLAGLVDAPKLSRLVPDKAMAQRQITIATPEALAKLSPQDSARSVLLMPDAFTYYYDAPAFWATHDVLVHLGYLVHLLPYRPNGKPLHIKGFLDKFKKLAEDNDRFFAAYAELDIPVICPEPSIALTWRDEYPTILKRKPKLQVQLLQEWLVQKQDVLRAKAIQATDPFYLVGHCMERTAQQASDSQWSSIFEALGLNLKTIPTGCCGMAGTYGHEREHVAHSKGIFEMSWQERLKDLPSEQVLVTGYSCRTQVKRFGNGCAGHPMVMLAKCLGLQTAT